MNLDRLMPLLPEDIDSALIITPQNRRYFTGFEASDGFVLASRNKNIFWTDSRYIEAARESASGCEVRLGTDAYKQISGEIAEQGLKNVIVEASGVTLAQFSDIQAKLADVSVIGTKELDDAINALRSVKSEEEVALIVKAQKIAEEALDHMFGFIRPGMTEKQVQLELDFYMLSHGAEALSFETIAVAGANSSKPHGVPGNYVIQKGDFLTLDFGATYGGYHSDMTRTVAVGSATEEMKKVYNIVLEAQLAGIDALCPGLACKDADGAARSVIEAAGYGEYFGHGTGHGVGIEIHEHPYDSMRSKETLAEGNVVTIEPGIYLPGKFGVRIEDMALITPDGHRLLTWAEKDLVIL